MLVTPIEFVATLAAKLEKEDRQLPLSDADNARLRAAVGDDDYTWLVLRDPTSAEIVKLENTCSTLLITRGEDGTIARTFPKGSCVRFETVPQIVKELICTHDCCAGGCPCEEVKAVGITLPAGKVGVEWGGTAVFSGDTPMTVSVTGQPSWASVEIGVNYIALRGTPTGAGSFTVSAAATNCDGKVATQVASFTITN